MRLVLCFVAMLLPAIPATAQRIVGPPTAPSVASGNTNTEGSPLTRAQMIARVVAGGRAYGCPNKPDWFSDQRGTCPDGKQTARRIIAVKSGYAMYEQGGFTKLKEQPSTARK